MKKIAKILRIIFIPPVVNLFLLVICYYMGDLFHGTFLILLVVTCLFPLLSYLLSEKVKIIKNKGRTAQRNLANIFCIIGYGIGLIIVILLNRSNKEIFLILTYFISGLILLGCTLINKKPSGHAAGVAGPIVYLLFVFPKIWLPISLVGTLILGSVYFSSLYLKRHTLLQLITGSLIPSFILIVLFVFFNM